MRQDKDFERTVKGELAVLYRVARRMGATKEQSEDAVQSTLLKAFQAWDRFDGRHPRSWLIRILRNERLMAIRSERDEVSLNEDASSSIPEQDGWDQVIWKIEADRVLLELENLPDIYKLAIQLCDVEQMSYEEAADAMDVPIGTVRSRLFRARTMLRNRLLATSARLERVTS
ncbi:MAG TPA: sigma-70 family RNA polymerase sigma factor [Fimbriimonadaceae bacterium]|nr:sigma-70 family RNA polymerase sigma factor [Fimbriimonadaceae bacterium]